MCRIIPKKSGKPIRSIGYGKTSAACLRLGSAAATRRFAPTARSHWRWSLPASVAACAAVGVLIVKPLVMMPASTALADARTQSYTASDRTRTLKLPDGSTVMLAPKSTIEVRFLHDRRQLHLRSGEAFFQVAHDQARPFAVTTRFGSTTDIGTAFNIRVDTDQAMVTVTEGIVRVAAQGDSTYRDVGHGYAVPLQRAPGNGRAKIGSVVAVDGQAATGWTTGWMRFEGAPLGKVVDEVNHYSAKRIVLTDPSRATIPVYAILKGGETDGLMALAAAQRDLGPGALKIDSP